jgi:hypothetical protein
MDHLQASQFHQPMARATGPLANHESTSRPYDGAPATPEGGASIGRACDQSRERLMAGDAERFEIVEVVDA